MVDRESCYLRGGNLVLEVIETYLVGGVIGFVVGVVVARIYFKSRIELKNIGQVIEYSLIHENITRLNSMTSNLAQLVDEMKDCSEDITEKLEQTKDIEADLINNEKKRNE